MTIDTQGKRRDKTQSKVSKIDFTAESVSPFDLARATIEDEPASLVDHVANLFTGNDVDFVGICVFQYLYRALSLGKGQRVLSTQQPRQQELPRVQRLVLLVEQVEVVELDCIGARRSYRYPE